ncbi:hypothetical protein ACFVIM_34245 [Streptomyces sp. NPDC057638]|uniref:hypothetical protein n=1 Tax=Streptomyces sp. NPDC057638 TaxID=3346190 RepID=UPI00367F2D6E
MQNSAVRAHAHHRTRPVHWLATAAALAAVIAGAALLQPDRATATPPGGTAGPAPARTPAPAPHPDAVPLPLECAGRPTQTTARAAGDLDGDSSPETVVAARCQAGSGTPPSGLYVLTGGPGGPRVVATLIDPRARQNVTELAVRDGVVTATVLGYSSDTVPLCCPDLTERTAWHWRGGAFVRTAPSAPAADTV